MTVLNKLGLVYRFVTSGQRVLPDFLIIGASSSGTTSLYNYLIGHPNIIPAIRKEIHFFDINYHRGLRWYRLHFCTKIHKRLKERKIGKCVTGEATPYYLFHPHAARRVALTLPEIKLIVLLRNPVDRAYSNYWRVRKKWMTLSFEDWITKELKIISEEEKKIIQD